MSASGRKRPDRCGQLVIEYNLQRPAEFGHSRLPPHLLLHLMTLRFSFTLEPDWRSAPLAFWVHVPSNEGTRECIPSAPVPVLHKGYAFLHVEAGEVDLQFSSLAQLQHFIDVMEVKPLPTSGQLTRKHPATVGPNGHWLSRLPATLKSPKARRKLVEGLRLIREQLVPLGDAWHTHSGFF